MTDIYLKNLNRIKEINPEFADKIDTSIKPNWANTIEWQGKPNLTIQTFDKLELAYKDVDKDVEEALSGTGLSLSGTACTFIVGAGVGHLQYQILKKAKKAHKLVVIEHELFFIKECLRHHDFTPYLTYDYKTGDELAKLKETSIYFATSILDAYSFIGLMDNVKNVDGWNFLTESYVRMRPLEYSKIIMESVNSINAVRCNSLTVVGAGAELAKNDIKSLPYLMGCPGVVELKDIYKDMPAVTVSTGPSLEKNIHYLKQYQDKVIIIAVAQALRVLKAYDIEPDFICTVDFGETNMGHFKGMMNSDTPLVCLNRTYSEILKQYKGPKFIVSNSDSAVRGEDTISSMIHKKGQLEQGGSVAHTCFSLAMHMGCNPICLIGQDLALTDKSHTTQVDEGGKVEIKDKQLLWNVTDHRSHLHKGEHKYSMGALHVTPGFFGKFVKTNSGLLAFIHAFEAIFRNVKDRIILNCTEGGARIKGSKQAILKDTLEKYAIKEKDKSLIQNKIKDNEVSIADAQNTIVLLNKELAKLHRVIKLANEGIKTAKQMESAKNEKRIGHLLKKNKKVSDEASLLSTMNPLLKIMIYWAEKKIHNTEHYIEPNDNVKLEYRKDDLKVRIKRNKLILKAVKIAAEGLIPLYNETRDKLKKICNSESIEEVANDLINIRIDDAKEYFDKGNFARPMTDARTLLKFSNNEQEKAECLSIIKEAEEMRELAILEAMENPTSPIEVEYSNEIYDGKEAGGVKDYDKAYKHLSRAYELCPDKEEAIRGMAVVSQNLDKFDDSIKFYEILNEKYPDNHEYFYECGISYILNKQIKEGMEKIGKAMDISEAKGEKDIYLAKMKFVGHLYEKAKMLDDAIKVYEQYYEQYPYDMEIKAKLEKLNAKPTDNTISDSNIHT